MDCPRILLYRGICETTSPFRFDDYKRIWIREVHYIQSRPGLIFGSSSQEVHTPCTIPFLSTVTHIMASLDLAFVRASFPAVSESRFVYADNAGGSQCLGSVVSRISDYLLHTNVQLGADYSVSVASTSRVNDGIEAARELLNAASVDEVAFGSSSTMLAENLARALDGDILDDEEIIITGEHEGKPLDTIFLPKR